MITVTKFGGSSVASSGQFKKVKNIVESDPKRKIVVVSALGKRDSSDSKITDLLYLLFSHIKYNVDVMTIYNTIVERYKQVQQELQIAIDVEREFNTILQNVKNGASKEYLISRGEYVCAKLMAAYLNYEFVDAAEVIKFGFDGKLDEAKTIEAVKSAFSMHDKIVVPGFYGSYPTGDIKLFSRGGSDITGSILAMSVGAEKYENWTDVSGILVTDPRLVKNAKRIDEVTYDELRELSYMGASVLHEETVFPIKELNIPIHILNTDKPNEPGTVISKEALKTENIITGISGRKNFKVFNVVKTVSANKLSVIKKSLEVFEKYNVTVEHIPTSIDTFSVVVEGKGTENISYDIIADLKKIDGIISVEMDNDLALIAVVGRNMVYKPGISGKVFGVFGSNNINIKTIAQGIKEISIIIGVANEDFEKSIKVLYENLVEKQV